MKRQPAWLLGALLAAGCFRTTVRSGNPPGEVPQGYDEKWHHGYLAGTVEGNGPHPLDRACPGGWAEVHSETDPLQALLHILTWTIYAPQTVRIVCAEPGSPAAPPFAGQGVPALPSGSAATFPSPPPSMGDGRP